MRRGNGQRQREHGPGEAVKKPARSWALEVNSRGSGYETWTTYINERNAVSRMESMLERGHDCRVVNLITGEVITGTMSGPPSSCTLCGGVHPGPYDGRCLL